LHLEKKNIGNIDDGRFEKGCFLQGKLKIPKKGQEKPTVPLSPSP
jgi:hypothetical protein